MNLSKCQIFTPPDIVKYMLDKIEYTENIYGKRIVDNSCGSGNILVEVVQRFIADAKKQKKRKAIIKKGLESCVYGYDIDPKMVNTCIENLNKVASTAGITNVKWNIFNEDGLYIQDTFDYVIGNPPYIAYLNLDIETREKTKDNFQSCKLGKFDYSYAFIEKGLSLLKDSGKMVMITPENMFKTVFAEKLREIMKPNLTFIIDCSAKKIFEDVLTTTAITVYEKNCKSNVLVYVELSDLDELNERIIQKASLVNKWNFTNFVDGGDRRFGDYYKASNCIATLANKVFIHTENPQGDLDIDIEPEILRVAKSPKSEQFRMHQKIIFPYYYVDGELMRYNEDELTEKYPKLMKYLGTKKEKLEERDSDQNSKWYEFGRSQALRHLNQEKLLISTIITKVVKVYELTKDVIPYSGIYITALDDNSLNDARLILQTTRFYNYLLTKGVKVSGDSIRISSKDLEEYRF